MGACDDIFEYLLERYPQKEVEHLILCIVVYGEPHFHSVEQFHAWWNMANLTQGGQKPIELARTKVGMEKVLQHLIHLS